MVAVDHRHPAAESAHRLRQFETHITASQDQQMLRNVIQFQRLDVGQRLRLRQPGNLGNVACVPVLMTIFFPRNEPRPTVGQRNLDGFGPRSALTRESVPLRCLVVVEMHLDQAVDHLALAFAHRSHVDSHILFADAELLASKK